MSLFSKKKRPEQAAFETIVTSYERKLLGYVSRLTGASAYVEDIVQETFVKLSQQWRGVWEPSPQISAWLYKVAHNVAIDTLRRERRRGEVHRSHADLGDESEAPTVGQGAVESTFDGQRVRDALEILSSRERTLVVLKVYEEKSYKEIAAIMGLSVSNVGYILHIAMRKLADHLSGEGERNGN